MLALLYFMLMQLMLVDASRALSEARRFRAKVVAATLAENGAELAAARLLARETARVQAEDGQGRMVGSLLRNSRSFRIEAEGITKGTITQKATVLIEGTTSADGRVYIDYFRQSQ